MNEYIRVLSEKKIFWLEKKNGNYYKVIGSIFYKKPKIANTKFKKKFKTLNPFIGRNIYALAFNYKSLVGKKKKYKEPLIFTKPVSSLINNNSFIKIPKFLNKTWVEVELAIMIKSKIKNIKPALAHKYILGFCCANDITTLNVYQRDWHLARSKGLDTFCPISSTLVTNLNTESLNLKSYINNQIMQNGNTSDRILNDFESLSLVSKYFTLYPGDIILTGTPRGATESLIQPGDKVRVTIDNVGSIINKVI